MTMLSLCPQLTPNLVGPEGPQNKVPTDKKRKGTRLRSINKSPKSKLHERKGTEILDWCDYWGPGLYYIRVFLFCFVFLP